MPTEGRDLRAEPSEEDEKAAREFIYSDILTGVGRGLEDLVVPYARFHAQAREAGRREEREAAVAWLRSYPGRYRTALLRACANHLEQGSHLKEG